MSNKHPIDLKQLEKYFQLHHQEDNFLDNVLEFIPEDEFEVANSWLLKRYIEEGNQPPPDRQEKILALLPMVTHWEARLHLLQILPKIPIAKAKAAETRIFLLQLVTEKNKFIRAWAYNGLYHLQACHPVYKKEVIELLNSVYLEEAPAVRSRIRNILGKNEWQT